MITILILTSTLVLLLVVGWLFSIAWAGVGTVIALTLHLLTRFVSSLARRRTQRESSSGSPEV